MMIHRGLNIYLWITRFGIMIQLREGLNLVIMPFGLELLGRDLGIIKSVGRNVLVD